MRVFALGAVLMLSSAGCASSGGDERAARLAQDAQFDAMAAHSRLPQRRGLEMRWRLERLVGFQTGHYAGEELLSSAISRAITGAPDQDRPLQGGAVLAGGCSRDNCAVKAALLLDRTDTLRAAALIHFNCFDVLMEINPRGGLTCAEKPTLTLVLPADGEPAWRAHLESWAREKSPDIVRIEVVPTAAAPAMDAPAFTRR